MGYPMSRRALQLTLFYLMCTLWYPSLLTWLYKYSSEIAISSVRAGGPVRGCGRRGACEKELGTSGATGVEARAYREVDELTDRRP